MQKTSPLLGAVVKAVTVIVPPLVLAVMSVLWLRNAAVAVVAEKVTIFPLNWSATLAEGLMALVTILVVVEPLPTVP